MGRSPPWVLRAQRSASSVLCLSQFRSSRKARPRVEHFKMNESHLQKSMSVLQSWREDEVLQDNSRNAPFGPGNKLRDPESL